MTLIRISMIAVLIAAAPAVRAGDDQVSQSLHVNAYLCETPQYAVAFAAAVAKGEEDESAKDIVGKTAEREVCGRYIGVAFLQEQKTEQHDGVMYRLTALRFVEDNRVAWMAESAFAPEGQSAWGL